MAKVTETIRDMRRPGGPDPKEARKRHMHDGRRPIPRGKEFHAEPVHHDGDWKDY